MTANRYALLIANGQYTHMPTLKAPPRDVVALERVLRDPAIGAFTDVTPLVDDPSPDNARSAITHFFSGKQPDDLLVVYFSGHGVVDTSDGSLHLAVQYTNPKLPYERSIEARFIVDAMKPNRCRVKTIVLIFDCCYSGAFDATQKSSSHVVLEMKQFDSGQGRVVITASTAVEPAYDAQGERLESLFTHYFVEGLATGQAEPGSEWVSVGAAYKYAYGKVKDKQTPEISIFHQQGEILLTHNPSYAPPVSTAPLSLNHHFICYSPLDGGEQAEHLHTALHEAGVRPWLDVKDTPAGYDLYAAREDALRECASVLLVMTPGSADGHSDSAPEWRRALQYKKPIIPLRFVSEAKRPLQVGNRAVLDFTGPFEAALTGLRQYLADLNSPAGLLRQLEYRKTDAEGELRGATGAQRQRILSDIKQLETDIAQQQTVVRDPQAAARTAEKRTEAALERERQPERPTGRTPSKFINPPPLVAPTYFQDRHVENRLIADFLRDPALRLLTVAGRGGVGKTAMVCRLLKALENGHLPDDLGELRLSGIVYLSAVGTHRVSFPNLFADLLKLLPAEQARTLEALYQDPHRSVADKLLPLCETLAEMPHPVVLLLDNLEDLLDPATHVFTDAEVDAALRALLAAPSHPIKCLLTTRIPPRDIQLFHPERQMNVPLDEGLPLEYAAAVLRAGDPLGVLGLKEAPDARLESAVIFTRGYPRALEALTATLQADRSTTLDDLLDGPPPVDVVEALVGQAYSRLDPTAQKVMQALAVYARPVPAAAVDYLLQLHLPGLDSTPVLNRLVNMRFVTKEAGRYYMHPVDRAYALQRLPPETEADREALKRDKPMRDLRRMFEKFDVPQSPVSSPQSLFTLPALLARAADYFRETRTPRAAWKTLADLAPQLAEIDLRYAAGDYDTAADVLSEIDFDYLLLWGHYRLMIEQHERLQGKLKDSTLRRISVGNLGTGYRSIGKVSKAIECYQKAIGFAQEVKNRHAENQWLMGIGNCYADLGDTRRAIEFYEQALTIAREIGDQRGEGAALTGLGNGYADLGDTRRAIEFYEQALTIAREIGDQRGEGAALTGLGNGYANLGQTRRAIEFYEQALTIAHEIGDRRGEGLLLNNLGQIYSSLGQSKQAFIHFESALVIRREIQDKYGEGSTSGNLARVLIDEKHYAKAIGYAQESNKIAEEISSPLLVSRHKGTLSLAYIYMGDLPAARTAARQARQYDVPENNHNVLALLGVITLRQKDFAAAHEAFTAAIHHADEMLTLTPELYKALDAKALALAGLAGVQNLTGLQDLSGLLEQARATYQAARAINSEPGIVQRVTRLLNQLEGVPKFWE